MGLDSFLARFCRRIPGRDCFAREVQEGAAFVFDSAARVAFLGSVCGAPVAPPSPCRLVLRTLDAGEALIESDIPQNIARWQSGRGNEVVPE
jgi:hypothetical protein